MVHPFSKYQNHKNYDSFVYSVKSCSVRALCSVLSVQCSVLNALCCALCSVLCAQFSMLSALYLVFCALWSVLYALCSVPCAQCSMLSLYAQSLCSVLSAQCSMLGSVLTAQCSLLTALCSVLRCSRVQLAILKRASHSVPEAVFRRHPQAGSSESGLEGFRRIRKHSSCIKEYKKGRKSEKNAKSILEAHDTSTTEHHGGACRN